MVSRGQLHPWTCATPDQEPASASSCTALSAPTSPPLPPLHLLSTTAPHLQPTRKVLELMQAPHQLQGTWYLESRAPSLFIHATPAFSLLRKPPYLDIGDPARCSLPGTLNQKWNTSFWVPPQTIRYIHNLTLHPKIKCLNLILLTEIASSLCPHIPAQEGLLPFLRDWELLLGHVAHPSYSMVRSKPSMFILQDCYI